MKNIRMERMILLNILLFRRHKPKKEEGCSRRTQKKDICNSRNVE